MRAQWRSKFAAMPRRSVERKFRKPVHVVLERAGLERHRGDLSRLVDSRGNARIVFREIGTVHHEDRRAGGEVTLAPRDLFGPRDEALHRFERQIRAVRIAVWQIDRQHAAAVGRFPGEAISSHVGADATPQNRSRESETGKNLRHLRDMPELVGQVSYVERPAEAARDYHPDFEIPNERFAAHEETVREYIPRTDLDFAGANQTAQARLCLRAHLEIVVEHDRLAVEVKRGNRAALNQRNHAIGHRDQPRAHLLERLIPFAIPMRVNDEIQLVHMNVSGGSARYENFAAPNDYLFAALIEPARLDVDYAAIALRLRRDRLEHSRLRVQRVAGEGRTGM